jgi:hypothetical protein
MVVTNNKRPQIINTIPINTGRVFRGKVILQGSIHGCANKKRNTGITTSTIKGRSTIDRILLNFVFCKFIYIYFTA